ncbi:uncharacterized protein LOC131695705 [Topomyia yanbarensis]|uniref:uncharacterized protein LOC131695705 n=1 Tax=Topomyia yanbarensis TaxID=2498891 RepID=UPI00273B0A21|nr:uncharacterized protein LOC131695705 [Topomyia yanbarensis]
MFVVVQFIEKQQFQVLVVPVCWVKNDVLMWPKLLANDKIEELRTQGAKYNGTTKKIPVIVSRRFKNLTSAEAAAEALAQKDVSDVDGKKKILKPDKKSKPANSKDYNKFFEEVASGSRTKSEQLVQQTKQKTSKRSTSDHCSLNGTVNDAPKANVDQNAQESLLTNPSGIINSNTYICKYYYKLLPNKIHCYFLSAEPNANPGEETHPILIDPVGADQMHDLDQVYTANDGIYYADGTTEFAATSTFFDHMDSLKHELNTLVQTTIEATVERSFRENFARLTSLLELGDRSTLAGANEETLAENHTLITDENELVAWNAQLTNKDLRMKYLAYFSKIIIPNSYAGKGDNACYTVVDCLFTRGFWNLFTWTGINRGYKSKRGFREFGNVTDLILKIVQIGDPCYTARSLELFCKKRLFRYSKARSLSKQLRKSACRPGRKEANQQKTSLNGKQQVANREIAMNDFEIDRHPDTDSHEKNDGRQPESSEDSLQETDDDDGNDSDRFSE